MSFKTHQLLFLFNNLWSLKKLHSQSHPVCGERSSIRHQVSDLIVLTFTSRLQQTLPQVHQRHLKQTHTMESVVMNKTSLQLCIRNVE